MQGQIHSQGTHVGLPPMLRVYQGIWRNVCEQLWSPRVPLNIVTSNDSGYKGTCILHKHNLVLGHPHRMACNDTGGVSADCLSTSRVKIIVRYHQGPGAAQHHNGTSSH